MTWQVHREAAIFLGAGRALLLQLAHPWVAAAIEQHSNTFADPIGRFHRTFSVVFSMVFGSLDQSLTAARRLHRRHAEINGRLPSAAGGFPAGSRYSANAIPALQWVHATLVESALLAYGLVLPPLTLKERERYYSENRLFAALFGIPDECLPRDWTAFSAYATAMVQSDTLIVTDHARIIGHRLIAGTDTWLPVPASYQALTAALLPPRIREAYGFPCGSPRSPPSGHSSHGYDGYTRCCRRGCGMSGPIKRRNNGLRGRRGRILLHVCVTAFGSAGRNCQKNISDSGFRNFSPSN